MTEYLPSDGREDLKITPSLEESWAPTMRKVAREAGIAIEQGATVDELATLGEAGLERMAASLRAALAIVEQAQSEVDDHVLSMDIASSGE
jgi:hypothetical protein